MQTAIQLPPPEGGSPGMIVQPCLSGSPGNTGQEHAMDGKTVLYDCLINGKTAPVSGLKRGVRCMNLAVIAAQNTCRSHQPGRGNGPGSPGRNIFDADTPASGPCRECVPVGGKGIRHSFTFLQQSGGVCRTMKLLSTMNTMPRLPPAGSVHYPLTLTIRHRLPGYATTAFTRSLSSCL